MATEDELGMGDGGLGLAECLQVMVGDVGGEDNYPCPGCHVILASAQGVRVGGSVWHDECVKCGSCGERLAERCYERGGKLYCKTHYYREFSMYKCSGCGFGVSPVDLVYKLKGGIIYHIDCHRCFHCQKQLNPGEQIVVDDHTSTVACLHHYRHLLVKNSRSLISHRTEDPSVSGGMEAGVSVPLDPSAHYSSHHSQGFYTDESNTLAHQKGPRTTIKQSQLDVLNRVFNATPKPSKHARAKLALETGLSMRVIQVWFQNRRSKERRLKHLCNWIRENENRGLIPPISPSSNTEVEASSGTPSSMDMSMSMGDFVSSSLPPPDNGLMQPEHHFYSP